MSQFTESDHINSELFIWDTQTEEEVGRCDCILEGSSIAFLNEEILLAAERKSPKIRRLRLRDWTQDGEYVSSSVDGFRAVAVSPCGRQIAASASTSGSLVVWDGVSGATLRDIRVNDRSAPGSISSISFSHDGRFLAAADGECHLWNTHTFQALRMRGGNIAGYHVSFARDKLLLATGGFENPATLWAVNSDSDGEFHSLHGVRGGYTDNSWSIDGRTLLSGRSIVDCDISPPTANDIIDPDGQLSAFPDASATSSTGSLIAVAVDHEIAVIDRGSARIVQRFKSPRGRVLRMAFLLNSKEVVAFLSDGSIACWDAEAGRATMDLVVEDAREGFDNVSLSVDGTIVLLRIRHSLVVLERAGSTYLKRFIPGTFRSELDTFADHIELTPNGFSAVRICRERADDDQHVHLIDLIEIASGTCRSRLRLDTYKSVSVAVSSDCAFLAAGSATGTITIWDLECQKVVREVDAHEGRIVCVSFDPTDKFLYSGSTDGSGIVWDVAAITQPATALKSDELDVRRVWDQLQRNDAGAAGSILRQARKQPNRVLSVLEKSLTPVSIPTRAEVDRLSELLDSDSPETRKRAHESLSLVADVIHEDLLRVCKTCVGLEGEQRIRTILAELDSTGVTAVQLRWLRCCELLEIVGDREALRLLTKLSAGPEENRLVKCARLSATRVKLRLLVDR